jgi:hypothetical protein
LQRLYNNLRLLILFSQPIHLTTQVCHL